MAARGSIRSRPARVLATSFDSGEAVTVEPKPNAAARVPLVGPAVGYDVPRSGWPVQAAVVAVPPLAHATPGGGRPADPASQADPEVPARLNDAELHSDIEAIVRQAASAQPAPVQPRPSPAAQAATARSRVFDELAASMAHARSYDLGSVALEQRFDDFDREADTPVPSARRSTGRPLPPPVSAPVPAPPPSVTTTDFIEDLDLIRSQSEIPLDPGVGGRSIGESALEPGDVILSTTSHMVSRAIRAATASEVSHAALYVGNGNVVEAIGDGVLMRSLETSLADDTLAVAYRHRDMTPAKASLAIGFAEQQVKANARYDHWGVIQVAPGQLLRAICNQHEGPDRAACLAAANQIRVGTNDDGSFFCSELVLDAFRHAGLSITTTDPSWSSPDQIVELHHNGLFDYVGHLIA